MKLKYFFKSLLVIYASIFGLAFVLLIAMGPILLVIYFESDLWFMLYFIVMPILAAGLFAYLQRNCD